MENKMLKGAKILVTGGTGSFGNAMIDYLKDSGATFIVYSRDESKQHDMWMARRDRNIKYIVGDIKDRQKLIYSMQDVDYVFHAAALKHVPTGEIFPEEVINTNTLGTKNVLEAAEYCGVKKVIVLSTDKAAYPISGYGMSKALAEKIAIAHIGKTMMVCLRYGNVLGSRGSVIPIFLEYVNQGKPVTITNSSMTRFVLTLREAVKLSLKCLKDGNSGDLFIMKPPSCTVGTLVDALELHFGRKLTRTIIGIRAGEKMHEVLLTGEEVFRSINEQEDGISYARIPAKRTNDYFFKGEDYIEPEDYSSKNSVQMNAEQVLNKLKEAGLL
jgi:UDP-N-acetylglucosamine 4,6-dehydratase